MKKRFQLNENKNSDFLDFEIVQEQKVWFQNPQPNSLTNDFANKKCFYFYKENLEFEDMVDLVQSIQKNNYWGLNISVKKIYQSFQEFGRLFFDKLFLAYDFEYELKSKKDETKILINVILDDQQNNEEVLFLEKISTTRSFAITLQDTPPNILNAEYFADQVQTRLSKYSNLKVNVLDKKMIQKEKMNLLLAVNAASVNEPRLVTIEYQGDPQTKEVFAIVGKGITFDSGGYALKDWKGMQTMKYDMSGAAIACMSLELIAQLKPKVNVVAIGCMTDNLIDGAGMVEDTVYTSMNGKTVEIENTDCEGRLVLADGVTYAIRKMKATKIFTIATLTGNVTRSLGNEFSGIFSRHEDFIESFLKATQNTFERTWRLPLTRINTLNQKHSRIADIWNEAPSGNGGASNGAGFIQEFTENKPFIHLDISSTAGGNQKHGTGVMIGSFVEYFQKTRKLKS